MVYPPSLKATGTLYWTYQHLSVQRSTTCDITVLSIVLTIQIPVLSNTQFSNALMTQLAYVRFNQHYAHNIPASDEAATVSDHT